MCSVSLSLQIPLPNIVKCTVYEKDFRTWGLCGKKQTVQLIAFQVAGSNKPIAYVGVKKAREFQRVVMALQSPRSSSAIVAVARPVSTKEVVSED